MAKAIMIQGTMSNAGKSLLAAALCRIFAQDGMKTAPFKSQNMALNSYITKNGDEMGRAQVVQAEAAGIVPDVSMNPVLLKPTTDSGSQVIVNGRAIGNMPAREYFAFKKNLIPVVKEAYEKLAREYDVIVIEGAGSPVELNLKEHDIVNMGMAKIAGAPVLLVGDIDRGGIFAQLYGTVKLLEKAEQQMIKGLVVNKFRGDVSLFEPGVKQLARLCGVPVAGVVPWVAADIDDEDSLSRRLLPADKSKDKGEEEGKIRIAVIRFPRISNFTDFTVFSAMPQVDLYYVEKAGQLGVPDLVILPGSKSTIADLLWMREQGLEAQILHLRERGVPLWGICGGYQMLGEWLEDEYGAEGEPGQTAAGMALLPTKTVFGREKTRCQVEGAFGRVEGIFKELSGKNIAGYEIHMGDTVVCRAGGLADTAVRVNGQMEICRRLTYLLKLPAADKQMQPDGLNRGDVYGSYVHGIFDAEGVAVTIAAALAAKKGIAWEDGEGGSLAAFAGFWQHKETQYNLLAEAVRKNLNMEMIYRILEQGISG